MALLNTQIISCQLPLYFRAQFLVSGRLYRKYSPQFRTVTTTELMWQSLIGSKHTVMSSCSPGVLGGCWLNQPGAVVPALLNPGKCCGILVPAAPVNLYHPAPFQSGLTLPSFKLSQWFPTPKFNQNNFCSLVEN